MGLELEPWFLPRFPAHFSPQGFFLAGFFLAPVLTAFALSAVAQLYEILKTLVRFLLVCLYFRFIFYFIYIYFIYIIGADEPQPNWRPEWHKA